MCLCITHTGTVINYDHLEEQTGKCKTGIIQAAKKRNMTMIVGKKMANVDSVDRPEAEAYSI